MTLDLRHIRYFIAVAKQQHFRRAAEDLGVAQPALSRAIRNLEQELGVSLFDRSNRSVQITKAGKVFLENCQGILTSLDHAIDQTQRAHRGQLGSLRIGYTDNAIAGQLPSLLKAFQDVEPGIVLHPFHSPTVEQLRRLSLNEIDVGFVTGPVSRPGFEVVPIQSEPFVCITYAGHTLAHRDSIKLAELADEDFVHGSSNEWQHFHAYLFSLCRRAGFEPRIVQQAFNTAGILGLVASGMGLTVLTKNSALAMPPGLVVLPIDDIGEELQTVAIWKKSEKLGPARLFQDYIKAYNKYF